MDVIDNMQTNFIRNHYEHISPAGAEIRVLMQNTSADLVHCTLRDSKISKAVTHKTVSEFWHVLSGSGAIWRKAGDQESITPLTPGVTIDIPLGTYFQYRADVGSDLVFLCVTMPPWQGHDEAHYVEKGAWEPTQN